MIEYFSMQMSLYKFDYSICEATFKVNNFITYFVMIFPLPILILRSSDPLW